MARASAVALAMLTSLALSLTFALPFAFALPQAIAISRAIRLRAAVGADAAVLFQAVGLARGTFLLRLRRAAVALALAFSGALTGTVLGEQGHAAHEQSNRDQSGE